jgi:hypothetical protein
MTLRCLLTLIVFAFSGGVAARADTPEAVPDSAAAKALQHSIDELRNSIGPWNVATSYLNPDGSVAQRVEGTYEFSWVIPDRVVSGVSRIPALEQASGILFYVREQDPAIEMVSVGRDGKLWIMTGPLGGSTRTSQAFRTGSGAEAILRFTRYNVGTDSFESKMEYSEDGGATWTPGNHQTFVRAKAAKPR